MKNISIQYRSQGPVIRVREKMKIEPLDDQVTQDHIKLEQLMVDFRTEFDKRGRPGKYEFPEKVFYAKYGAPGDQKSWENAFEYAVHLLRFELGSLEMRWKAAADFMRQFCYSQGMLQMPTSSAVTVSQEAERLKVIHPITSYPLFEERKLKKFNDTKLNYNMTAELNGCKYSSGVVNQLTPKRGVLNNNLPLHYIDVNFSQQLNNTNAVLHVLCTTQVFNFSFNDINDTYDSVNRIDQKVRSQVSFSALELVDVTDQLHPRPVDPLSKAFSQPGINPSNRPSSIEIGGYVIDLDEINKVS